MGKYTVTYELTKEQERRLSRTAKVSCAKELHVSPGEMFSTLMTLSSGITVDDCLRFWEKYYGIRDKGGGA